MRSSLPSPSALVFLLATLLPLSLAQSSSSSISSRALPPTTTTASPSSTFLGTPSLVFVTVPTVTACGSAQLNWRLYNEDSTNYNITFQVLNYGVNQAIPSAASTSTSPAAVATTVSVTSSATSASSTLTSIALAPRYHSIQAREDALVNIRIGSAPASSLFNWSPITLPQGRYFILGTVNDAFNTSAPTVIFTVMEGSNTSCLADFNPNGNSSVSSTVVVTGSSTSRNATPTGSLASAATTTGNGHWSTGAIVGAVIGILAGLALLGILAFCCLRRRRRREERYGAGEENMQEHNHRGGGGGFANRLSLLGAVGAGAALDHTLHSQTSRGVSDDHTSPESYSSEKRGMSPSQLVAQPIALASIRSFRPDSIGSIDDLRKSTETLHENTPHGGEGSIGHDHDHRNNNNPFSTPMETPANERWASTGSFGVGEAAVAGGAGAAMAAAAQRQRDSDVRRASNPVASANRSPDLLSANSSRRSSANEVVPGGGHSRKASAAGSIGGVHRSESHRRKPVPQLGPELKSELARQASMRSARGDVTPPERRQSYKLVADRPLPQE